MVDGVQSRVVLANYAAAIQDALGNGGASAQLDISSRGRTVMVTGTPSGAASSPAAGPATILALSPEAQNVLSNAQIALTLMRQNPSVDHQGTTTPDVAAPGRNYPARSHDQAPNCTVPSQLSSSSISDIVKSGQAALTDPAATFYDYLNSLGGPASWASFMSDDHQRQSFIAAFNNNTLQIRNAVDVPGLDYEDRTTLTGTSEVANISVNEAWVSQEQKATGTYSTGLEFPVIGGLFVSWAKPPNA